MRSLDPKNQYAAVLSPTPRLRARTARDLGARYAVSERTGARVVDHAVNDVQKQAEHARARLTPERRNEGVRRRRNTSGKASLKDIERALGLQYLDNSVRKNRSPAERSRRICVATPVPIRAVGLLTTPRVRAR